MADPTDYTARKQREAERDEHQHDRRDDQESVMTRVDWGGPLFYPPVGKIAVTKLGSRIEVWPDESESDDCFTGLMLLDGTTSAQIVVHDLSCMWGRQHIDHIEEPSEEDLRLGILPRADTLREGRGA